MFIKITWIITAVLFGFVTIEFLKIAASPLNAHIRVAALLIGLFCFTTTVLVVMENILPAFRRKN